MTERLLESIPLENGLTLEILDACRITAGDRWLVHLIARIRVPAAPGLLDSIPDGRRLLEILKRECGETLEYRADLKRHFVSREDRDRVFQEFRDIVRGEKRPYLSHPEFPRRFALSCLSELTRKKPLLFH
jgi:hypothetical protein